MRSTRIPPTPGSATASSSATRTGLSRRGVASRAGGRQRPRDATWSSRFRAERSRLRVRRSASSGRGCSRSAGLRLNEIQLYLDACMNHYRPLAAFLIGTGARISEALAIQYHHEVLACAPVLEPDDAALCRIELAQSELGLLGDDRGRVLALEAKPGDVGLLVVVAVDLHRILNPTLDATRSRSARPRHRPDRGGCTPRRGDRTARASQPCPCSPAECDDRREPPARRQRERSRGDLPSQARDRSTGLSWLTYHAAPGAKRLEPHDDRVQGGPLLACPLERVHDLVVMRGVVVALDRHRRSDAPVAPHEQHGDRQDFHASQPHQSGADQRGEVAERLE